MKTKTLYRCTECAFEAQKWMGKCPECENWNSLKAEEMTVSRMARGVGKGSIKSRPREPETYEKILSRLGKETEHTPTGIAELDMVLGGGILPGALFLLGGEPGIGKSTLTLQICDRLSSKEKQVLYISGEESLEQVSLRGKRLNLGLKKFKLLNENNLETILATLDQEKPDLAVIDSIQVIFSHDLPSAAGTVSQVRYATEAFMQWAKPKRIPLLLIGHVTKDGNLAGPRVLEHLVDGVFLLEGDRFHEFRMLRSVKNRFGPTNEVGIFEMGENGLQEVKNPSAHFLQTSERKAPGVALIATIEGTRPLIIEVQALVSKTRFGYPRRMSSGFDLNRLNLLLAVMERHLKVNFGDSDVFVNIVGGMKLSEPATDLGISLAILSSLKQKVLPLDAVFAGEIGLTGEIRKVKQREKRSKEAKALGLTFISPNEKQTETLQRFAEKYLA